MTDAFYASPDDPYCYSGTNVLKNRPGIRDGKALDAYEATNFGARSLEPLPSGRFGVSHFRSVHRHLFGDVYRWAGRFRSVRIHKRDAAFCYPEHIPRQMDLLFGELRRNGHLRSLDREAFSIRAADFLATLNQIHPFREGNGRTQTAFLAALASRARHPLNFGRLDERAFLEAIIVSFHDEMRPLQRQLLRLID